MTLKTFVFFDAENTETESNVMSSLERAEDMTLHVTAADGGTVNLEVKGRADENDGDWETIAVIDLGSFGVANSIAGSGIYSIPLRGLTQVKIVNNGTPGVKVYGRIMA